MVMKDRTHSALRATMHTARWLGGWVAGWLGVGGRVAGKWIVRRMACVIRMAKQRIAGHSCAWEVRLTSASTFKKSISCVPPTPPPHRKTAAMAPSDPPACMWAESPLPAFPLTLASTASRAASALATAVLAATGAHVSSGISSNLTSRPISPAPLRSHATRLAGLATRQSNGSSAPQKRPAALTPTQPAYRTARSQPAYSQIPAS